MKHLPICIFRPRRFAMAVLFTATIIDVAFSQPGFWQSLNGPEGGVVQCFAADNSGDILAGTYFGGVYKSTNRGVSWAQLPYVNLDIRSLAVNASGTIFLGAATSGLWKSTDGGATWVRPTNILNNRTVTSVAFHSSGNVIAGCASTSSQSVFQSTDNGETFFQVSAGVLSGNSVIRQGANMYVAGDRNGVLRSTDGGFLWTTINPSSSQFNGLSMTSNANYVYVVGRRTAATTPDSSFIYRRSVSTGAWELVHIQRGVVLRTISSVGDTLLAAGDSTVLVSFNAGQSWIDRSPQATSAGPIALYYYGLAASRLERDAQLGGCVGGGIVRSTDFFSTWNPSVQGMYNTHIVAKPLILADRILISTQFNGRWKYDLTNQTWARTGGGLPANDVVASFASDNSIVYVGNVTNGLWSSSNWGETCSQSLFGTNATGFATIYASPSIAGFVLAGGRGERPWKTTDGGGTWTFSLLPGSPYSITGITAVNQNEYFVATGNFGGYGAGNGVYKTTNGGSTYTHHGLQFTGAVSFDRSSNNKLVFGSASDQVLEGDVNVTTWTATPSLGLGVKLRDVMFYEYPGQPIREIAATSVGLCEREAFSQGPWVKRALGGFEVARIEVVRAPAGPLFTGQIIAGTYGGGVHQSTGPLTSVGEKADIPDEFALEQNYPNPFNPTTTLRFSIPYSAFVILKVYDLLGREVATLVNEVRVPGSHEVMWDARGMSSGVYFYRLAAGEFVATKKLLFTK